MDIDNIIQGRRSSFPAQYSGDKIPERVVLHLLENANWAPTHYHTEPWRFKVFADGGLNRLMDALAAIYKERTPEEAFSQAKFEKYTDRKSKGSHAIVIVMKKSLRPDLPEVEEVCATACAVQNMWLTLANYPQYGGYWSTGHLVYTDEFREFLHLEEDEMCLGIFYLGSLREDAREIPGRRGDWNEKVSFQYN